MAAFLKTAAIAALFILKVADSSFPTTNPPSILTVVSPLVHADDTVFLAECKSTTQLWQGDTIESANPKGFFLLHNAGKLQFYQGYIGNSSSILRWQSTGYTYDGDALKNTFTAIQGDGNIVVYTTDGYIWSSQSSSVIEQGCFLVWSFSKERLVLYAGTQNVPGNELWNSDREWEPFHAEISPTEQKVRMIASRISATLSIIGSGLLIGIVVSRNIKGKRMLDTRDRLLLGMSFLDFLATVAHAFSVTPIPEDSVGTIGAKGNTATCAAQGFFIQVGFGVPLYNAMICVYFLLIVRYKKKESFLALKAEPIMHFIALGFAIFSASIGLFLELYNSNAAFCWIEPYPYDCAQITSVKCLRGEDAYFYQWLFGGMVVMTTFLIITVSMLLIYCTLRSNSRKMKHHYGEEGHGNTTQVSETGKQAFLYVIAFLLTFLGPMLLFIFRQVGHSTESWFHISVSILYPLQGFWNIIIFLRPPFRRIRRKNEDKSFFWVLKKAIVTESATWRGKASSRRPSFDIPNISYSTEKSGIFGAAKNFWEKNYSSPFQTAGSENDVDEIRDATDIIDTVKVGVSSEEEKSEEEQY